LYLQAPPVFRDFQKDKVLWGTHDEGLREFPKATLFDFFEKGKRVNELVSIQFFCVLGNKHFAGEA
jgi:hypothetical protein